MSCGIGEREGELTIGNPYHLQVHFTPKDQYVWLVFAVRMAEVHASTVHKHDNATLAWPTANTNIPLCNHLHTTITPVYEENGSTATKSRCDVMTYVKEITVLWNG